MNPNPVSQTCTFQLSEGVVVNDKTLQEFLQHQLNRLMSKIELQNPLQNGTYSVALRMSRVDGLGGFALNSENLTYEENARRRTLQDLENLRHSRRTNIQSKD